jgi:cytochrome P450
MSSQESIRIPVPERWVQRQPGGHLVAAPDTVSRSQGAAQGTGPLVVCGTGGAGRDRNVFDAPEDPTLDRWPDARLAFGFGPHPCLSRELARAELQTVLDVLLRRLPSLELAVTAEDPRRLEGLAVGGLREVPVRR